MVYGLKLSYAEAQVGWLHDVGEFGVTFFMTYLVGESKNASTYDAANRHYCVQLM